MICRLRFVDNGEYCKQIENYINDRFGLRDLMIRTKNEINYTMFGETGKNGCYVGKDGYLFYKGVVDTEQIANEKLTESDLNGIGECFKTIKRFCNDNSSEFYFMITPQKNEVFPERAVDIAVERPVPNAYQKLCTMFIEDDELQNCFIDTCTLLQKADLIHETYYRTDFHWNSYGANVAFAPIVNDLGKKAGYIGDIFNEYNYDINYIEGFKGGQLYNIPMLRSWSEKAVVTTKKGNFTSSQVTDGNEKNAAFHWINNDENAKLGSVLLIGDSYTEYLVKSGSGILDCFEEGYWVHINNSKDAVSNYIDDVDYVVFEIIESSMPKITGIVENLKETSYEKSSLN